MVKNVLFHIRALTRSFSYGTVCARPTVAAVNVNKNLLQLRTLFSSGSAAYKIVGPSVNKTVKQQQQLDQVKPFPFDVSNISSDMAELNAVSIEPVSVSSESDITVSNTTTGFEHVEGASINEVDPEKQPSGSSYDVNVEDSNPQGTKRKWFGDKRKTKKGKKLDRHPKKIEKFVNDQKFNETEYYFENGLRKVIPYVYVFESHVKGRWMKRSVLDVFQQEFRCETPEYYKKAISSGLITIDGKRVSLDKIMRNNEFLRSMVHRHEPPVTSQPLEIINIDEELVVINKPASIPVHPCGKYRHNTIIFLLGKEFGLTGLHTIHRLDRLTSGLLMFARTRQVSQRIDAYVRERKLTKTYLCKVVGEFPSEPIDCIQPIFIISHKIGVCRVSPDGKQCKTYFKRLSYDGHTSIVKCFPHTGRMHQIRVHLQYLGYPIVNDPLYNNPVWGPQLGKGGDIPHRNEGELLNELIKQHTAEIESQVIQDPEDFVKTTRYRLVEGDCPKVESTSSEGAATNERGEPHGNLIGRTDVQCVNTTTNYINQTGDDNTEDSFSCSDEKTTRISESKHNVSVEGSKPTEDRTLERWSNFSASVDEPSLTGLTVPQDSDGSTCQQAGTPTLLSANEKDTERPLESENEMTEEERRQLVQDMCRECKLQLRDPKPEEMIMYLHALSYKGPDFEFSTPLPVWAEEHIQRTTAMAVATSD